MNSIDYYNTLTDVQKARWIALLMAIENIEEYCTSHKKTFNEKKIKPVAIKHFIEEKTPQIEYILNNDTKNREIKSTIYNLRKCLIGAVGVSKLSPDNKPHGLFSKP